MSDKDGLVSPSDPESLSGSNIPIFFADGVVAVAPGPHVTKVFLGVQPLNQERLEAGLAVIIPTVNLMQFALEFIRNFSEEKLVSRFEVLSEATETVFARARAASIPAPPPKK
jgi:hypothetical protein